MLSFPELDEWKQLLDRGASKGLIEHLGEVEYEGDLYPLDALVLGNTNVTSPTFAIFGGVHGLERIGARVALSYLKTVLGLMDWDESFENLLSKVKMVFMPLINPVGIKVGTRSNGNGVDLMRNAPVEADYVPWWFLPGGHRVSPKLPWYRGTASHTQETEVLAVQKLAEKWIFPSQAAISIDLHSGYGSVDRLWFPYAKSRKPFPRLAEMVALKNMLDSTYPNHIYKIEPQFISYMTHGDLWDYLLDQHDNSSFKENFYLPLSLEMGSWSWIRKNPLQIFSSLGVFNPMHPHRSRRVLRRHIPLFEFLFRAILSHQRWLKSAPEKRNSLHDEGIKLWYGKAA